MTATDDRITLHELKSFASECDDAAERLDRRRALLSRLTPVRRH